MKKPAIVLSVLMLALGIARAADASPATEGNIAMIESRLEIAALVNDWAFFRDSESWSELQQTFHDEGTISLSWFHGPHKAFVAASQNLAKSGNALLKHTLGTPRISINGDKALSETNVVIMVRTATPFGEVDTTSYARFFDRLEKRDGVWKIVARTAIYEKDRADPVTSAALPVEFFQGLDKYPAELRFLARSLDKGGVPLSPATVLDKSPELASLYAEGRAWLAGD